MSIPTNWIFPLHADKILSEKGELQEQHWRDFLFTLQRMYEQVAQGVNGTIRADTLPGNQNWTPTLQGGTPGTFTYNHQVGWVLRRGIIVDVWFDVSWSAAGTAAGNLYLELPYIVSKSLQKPFVGVVQSSTLAYTGGTGIVINAIPNTYRGEFWNVGSGFATANQAVVAAGQLIGHIRYIGQGNE